MTDRLPLPSPMDYCYEWDGLYGTRKFSAALHNGAPPSRSVPIYTADQMHAYSDASNAALRADNTRIQNEVVGPLRERVKVLEGAIQHYESALRDAWPEGAKGASWEFWNRARAALEATR